MVFALPVWGTTTLAAASVLAYLTMWPGWPLQPMIVSALAVIAGGALAAAVGRPAVRRAPGTHPPVIVWALVVTATLGALIRPVWPDLLPPGGASDLTHHLMLVDVLERTRQLVDGAASEGAMGEMAHYTPGLHLLIVLSGALAGMDAFRAAYPLLAVTIALKAGLVWLLAYGALGGARGRTALSVTAVGFVLFAPRAYSLDGFLQAGFYAQVASELFVVAGWWGLAQWCETRARPWLMFVGLMGAATFLVWPIWIGPLLLPVAVAVFSVRGLSWPARVGSGAIAAAPAVAVAAMHLWQHAAWLRIAGTSGAVPVFAPGALGWLLIVFAAVGSVSLVRRIDARVLLWSAAAIVLQAAALWLLARARGAATPYMAMKMIYLGVYPVAALGAAGVSALTERVARPAAAGWAAAAVVLAVGVRSAVASPLPAPLVDLDLERAGRWARANVPASCVDYIVDNAEQAYWLHLSVLGQPRSSPRTADIDGYTSNRAIGRWLEGGALPVAVARDALLPGELLGDADVVYRAGTAVVLRRVGVAASICE